MVDTLISDVSEETHAGSSPVGRIRKHKAFFFYVKLMKLFDFL